MKSEMPKRKDAFAGSTSLWTHNKHKIIKTRFAGVMHTFNDGTELFTMEEIVEAQYDFSRRCPLLEATNCWPDPGPYWLVRKFTAWTGEVEFVLKGGRTDSHTGALEAKRYSTLGDALEAFGKDE